MNPRKGGNKYKSTTKLHTNGKLGIKYIVYQ